MGPNKKKVKPIIKGETKNKPHKASLFFRLFHFFLVFLLDNFSCLADISIPTFHNFLLSFFSKRRHRSCLLLSSLNFLIENYSFCSTKSSTDACASSKASCAVLFPNNASS